MTVSAPRRNPNINCLNLRMAAEWLNVSDGVSYVCCVCIRYFLKGMQDGDSAWCGGGVCQLMPCGVVRSMEPYMQYTNDMLICHGDITTSSR